MKTGDLLFVYGTLHKGERWNKLLPNKDVKYEGKGWLLGTMYWTK